MIKTNQPKISGWYSESEMKELTGFQTVKLWELRKRGLITASRIGRSVYYSEKSLMDLLEKNSSK